MPVAIVRGRSWMPVVAEAETDEALLDWLATRRLVPRELRADVEAARRWLGDQPWPFGWFETMDDARARLRSRIHRHGDDLDGSAAAAPRDPDTIVDSGCAPRP